MDPTPPLTENLKLQLTGRGCTITTTPHSLHWGLCLPEAGEGALEEWEGLDWHSSANMGDP